MDVCWQVVEFYWGFGIAGEVSADGFPGAFSYGLLFALFMEFPVKVVVFFLLFALAE